MQPRGLRNMTQTRKWSLDCSTMARTTVRPLLSTYVVIPTRSGPRDAWQLPAMALLLRWIPFSSVWARSVVAPEHPVATSEALSSFLSSCCKLKDANVHAPRMFFLVGNWPSGHTTSAIVWRPATSKHLTARRNPNVLHCCGHHLRTRRATGCEKIPPQCPPQQTVPFTRNMYGV